MKSCGHRKHWSELFFQADQIIHNRWNCFSRSKRFLSAVTKSPNIGSNLIQVSEEVQEALTYKKAVVALESTIITHGMPYPHNYSTALRVEKKVRQSGAVPATVAVLNGKMCIGLKDSDLGWLAEKSHDLIKVSRRDLPYVLSHGFSGGTTVSATMIAAHMAGIPIFATGGIGGVHRGAETSFDISADLTELGRTSVVVVSSGVKSILDIPKTLEYLETQGVCVATFGEKKNFPAFFTKDSGYYAPYNIATIHEAAKMIDIYKRTGLNSGMLIAVPIPDEFAATGEIIQNAIDEAVESARKNNIIGKDVTPYILSMVSKITKGESLAANIALVENNASVAGGIAKYLAQIRSHDPEDSSATCLQSLPLKPTKPVDHNTAVSASSLDHNTAVSASSLDHNTAVSASSLDHNTAVSASSLDHNTAVSASSLDHKKTSEDEDKLSGRPVVIGATVLDFTVQVGDPNIQFNGATYQGRMSQTFGGVGRNLADCLSRLQCNPVFISAVGMDNLSHALSQHCKHIDLHSVQTLHNMSTATYCPVLLASGQLLFGVGNMDINSHFTLNKGCVLSPDLFNLYSESVMRSLQDIPEITVGGHSVNNLRYADVTVMIAENEIQLQEMVDIIATENQNKGLSLNSRKTKVMITDLDLMIKSAPLVLLDGNFTPEVIEEAVFKCADMSVPVWFEPTDLFKSVKPFETEAWRHLTFISPNLGELTTIYSALMKKLDKNEIEFLMPNESAELEEIIRASVQMCLAIVPHIPVVLVTLGKHGVLLCHRFGDASHLLPLPSASNCEDQFKATYYSTLNADVDESKTVSVSGAGDCFASAFIAGMLQGFNLDLCIKQGFCAAFLSLQSPSAVPETLSTKTVMAEDAFHIFSNWKPIDVTNGYSD